MTDRDLRRRIDRAVSRAMFDADYQRALLADPGTVVATELADIRALSLVDFAHAVVARFWTNGPCLVRSAAAV